MDYSLSEEQKMLKKTARDFLEKECPESFVREMREDEDGYSPEVWRRIADLGWLGLIYPENYGGMGGNILDMTVLYEEMGRAMFPGPHLSTVVICGLTILAAGSEEQKIDLLPRIAKGDLIMTMALTEPQSSWDGKAWDAEGITVRATRDKDFFIIDGTKLFVHDAHAADYFLCVTRTREGAKPENGITLFLVDAKSPGIRYTPLETIPDDKQYEVVFNKVKVPKENMVGKLHGGWPPVAKALQNGAVLLCAEMTGAGARLLELSLDYANSRVQFDMPIGINQYVQEFCVNIATDTDASRWLTYHAAWRLSQGLPCDMEIAMAKAWTSDAYERACWNAHSVYGGAGCTLEMGVLPLYSSKALGHKLYLGDTPYYLEKVAQEIEKWPEPERPRGKPLGIWNIREDEQIPAWQPWREHWEKVQKDKEDRRKIRAQKK